MESLDNKKYLDTIDSFLNMGKFREALELTSNKLSNIVDLKNAENILMLFSLAGKLIDIGNESRNKTPIIDGLRIIESNLDLFKNIVWQGSINYCVGNAKQSLFDIMRSEKDFKYNLENIKLLVETTVVLNKN